MQKKVMVIDDQEEMIEYIRTGLEMNGYCVVSTSDALKAVELAKSEKPDIIILDFVMPGTDGDHISKDLGVSDITKDIPIIFVTGNFSSEITRSISRSKAYFCILKPFELTELLERINDSLSISSTKNDLETKKQLP
ncbi:MAG: response regulator [Elusimicrobia bacterium]|nr:response regulator [Candidatus Liberimonas magnetica]